MAAAAGSPETAWYELLGKAVSAAAQIRVLRAAEYFGRAAADARALWGEKGTVIVARSLLFESSELAAHVRISTAVGAAAPLWLDAHRLVAECRRILNARLSANTCLVGRCFAVEEDFYARYNVMLFQASRGGVALTSDEKAAYVSVKSEVGYEACLEAARQGLWFAYPAVAFPEVHEAVVPPLTGEERSEAQAFALRCVGIMATAQRIEGPAEWPFARFLRDLLDSSN